MTTWTLGHWYALCSFMVWGTFPLYWKLFQGTDPLLLTCKRIFYTSILLIIITTWRRHWGLLKAIILKPSLLGQLLLATLLISTNWLVFVMAVNKGATWESSLGYYLGPVLSMAMGAVLLKERWTLLGKISFLLACTGLLLFFIQAGSFPWMALYLAASFACYGLVKKRLPIPSLHSLAIEVLLLSPLALIYIISHSQLEISGQFPSFWLSLLLVLSGPMTLLPLYYYGKSAQMIPLGELGMMQYVSPTIQFFTAFFIFGEPLHPERLMAFSFIWLALIIYLMPVVIASFKKRGRKVS